MSPSRILLLIAVICFVIAAIVAAGTAKVLTGADVWGYVGLAFFAASGLV
jgi:hypothetical protein